MRHGSGLFVLSLTGDRICALTRFDSSAFPSFGVPRSLPDREPAAECAFGHCGGSSPGNILH